MIETWLEGRGLVFRSRSAYACVRAITHVLAYYSLTCCSISEHISRGGHCNITVTTVHILLGLCRDISARKMLCTSTVPQESISKANSDVDAFLFLFRGIPSPNPGSIQFISDFSNPISRDGSVIPPISHTVHGSCVAQKLICTTAPTRSSVKQLISHTT